MATRPVAKSVEGITARPNTASKRKIRKSSRKQLFIGLIVLVAALGLLFSILYFRQNRNLNDVKVIVHKVSKHYALPTNETPALATVTDSKKVQASFAGKVANDDKVLIYENNKKAIVYRPSIDRIVDVEPVTVGTPSTSTDSNTTKIPERNPFGN